MALHAPELTYNPFDVLLSQPVQPSVPPYAAKADIWEYDRPKRPIYDWYEEEASPVLNKVEKSTFFSLVT